MLEITELDVAYGQMQALWQVSLSVTEGECVAVPGANGAGKTTLLSAIAGLLRPLRGGVSLAGTPIHGLPAFMVCERRIALVPEGGQLFADMTVRENLEIGAYLPRTRGRAAANLERAFELFPRLAERAKLAAGALSGGERQMLATRALMSEPRLLMLDEPSLGLAPIAVDHVLETLAQLRRGGLTILLVEQNIAHALELANRGYVLERGRVVRSAAATELAGDPALRRHFLGI